MKVMLGSDKFDKRNSQKLSRLFDQLGSENWYVREHAQISIARMLEEDYNHTLKNMLQKYCCSGDLEQKYRVEQLLPLAPDNSRLIRVRLKPLANLALLLHGEQGVRSKAAERLKGRVKVAESLISASLETRTEFVLKALDKLYPTEKNNRENTEK